MNSNTTTDTETRILQAQKKSRVLLIEACRRDLIRPGIMESVLNQQLYDLAFELFGTRTHWHKRLVRAGLNTIRNYKENPPDLLIKEDDIIYVDFGPVFENFEGDIGRTFYLGQNPIKLKLLADLQTIFDNGKQYYRQNPNITGKDLYKYLVDSATNLGWSYRGEYAGHIVGEFSHKIRCGKMPENYICLSNNKPMSALDKNGDIRHWILEVHLNSKSMEFGGFYEDLLDLD